MINVWVSLKFLIAKNPFVFKFEGLVTLTVWKFHDFSITQILCEINIWDSRSAKSAILD